MIFLLTPGGLTVDFPLLLSSLLETGRGQGGGNTFLGQTSWIPQQFPPKELSMNDKLPFIF